MKSRCRGVNCAKKQLVTKKIFNKLWERKIWERFEVRTLDDKPIWTLLKEYINSLKIDGEFTRKDLLSCVYVKEIVPAMRGNQTSVDQYRRWITMNGFLYRSGWGIYKKIKNIPENASINKLRNHAYDGSWRSWYIKPEDL